jgi:hypothetical protein
MASHKFTVIIEVETPAKPQAGQVKTALEHYLFHQTCMRIESVAYHDEPFHGIDEPEIDGIKIEFGDDLSAEIGGA